ncbi:FixH family protein [Bacillus sp. 31A1R]|uniref:FixH family protein n=1 Tax=Robertmurraya mangrovi TaxID=3098077 RepID=A0ABU5IYD3_9BACI|nr:FixH family protein [Bacillus sp. 31A1R]MDZ5472175.1 FixH family protein [Bacillus sp. 31A1R]
MKKLFIFLLTIVALTACGKSEDKKNAGEEVPAMIEAVLEVPEEGKVDEEITFSVIVTQDAEAVEDANEVKFEIWEEGHKEESELIEAKPVGDGKYTVTKSFDKEGIFTVQSHVTARSMHTMPKENIQIGNPVEESHDHEEAEESSHHHHGDVTISLSKDEHIHANKETELKVQLGKKDEPINNAVVRLEIYKPKEDTPEWVETVFSKEGQYVTKYTFSKLGQYKVVIHATNNEGLHEHSEELIDIH